MPTKQELIRPFGETEDRLAIAADQIRTTHHRGCAAWFANLQRRRRLAREERLEWIERLQRLERRKRQSGEYVPDRRHYPHWL